jgi:rSAM/selenodomain-associated transferase 2
MEEHIEIGAEQIKNIQQPRNPGIAGNPAKAIVAPMISVVIPTYNAEQTLAPTLAALVPAVVDGIVQEAIIVDGGSSDGTAIIADAAGAKFLHAPRGSGSQLQAGAAAARGDWLLFLQADTMLEPGWADEAEHFMRQVALGTRKDAAASFRFTLDEDGLKPRLMERLVGLRCLLFALPYGGQGLLISRALYRELGGFRPMPLMEDFDFMRRLKRRERVMLRSRAVTTGGRHGRDGYVTPSLRNLCRLTLYSLRVPPKVLARLYG